MTVSLFCPKLCGCKRGTEGINTHRAVPFLLSYSGKISLLVVVKWLYQSGKKEVLHIIRRIIKITNNKKMELISFKQKYMETLKAKTPSRWKVRGFAMLPNSLLFDDVVGKAELLVFWVLTMHLFRGKEYTMPSVRQIQQEAKISRPTVIAAIKSLERLGYLQAERKVGRRTKYYLKIKI